MVSRGRRVKSLPKEPPETVESAMRYLFPYVAGEPSTVLKKR